MEGKRDIDLRNVKGKYDLSTGTGYVDLIESQGDFDLSSGTGNVKIKNCEGDFDASSGTGNVSAEGLTIDYEGDFSSGTGDVEVEFPQGTDFELTVASGTDDAVLDMNLQPSRFIAMILLSFPNAIRIGRGNHLGEPFYNLEIKTKFLRDERNIYRSLLETLGQITNKKLEGLTTTHAIR